MRISINFFRWTLLTAFVAGVLIFSVLRVLATATIGPLGAVPPGLCGGGDIAFALPWDTSPDHGPHGYSTTSTAGATSNTATGLLPALSGATWTAEGVPAAPADSTVTITAQILEGGVGGAVSGCYQFSYNCTTGAVLSSGACASGGGGGGAAAAPVEPPPANADVFLSDVCEPFDGFSADGWMTWNTNAAERNVSWQLFVGSSIDGPWVPVEGSPPWIISRDTMNIIAQAVGVADYHGVWMKVGENGPPVNAGSAIIGRDYRMVELCGGELPPLPGVSEVPPEPAPEALPETPPEAPTQP